MSKVTAEQIKELELMIAKAKKAAAIIENYDQAKIDRLCQAVAWAVSNLAAWEGLGPGGGF